uniref:Tail fiber domain containing protein n=1 Tax=Escherichia phage phiEco273 TaxID=3239875 RepID=A0AB39JAS0_9CAUD
MAAGTLSVTNNSKAVVGVGTTFTAFKAGDFLTLVVGQVPYTVAIASIESATALTLVLPFDGPTATGLAWDGVKRDTMSLATMGVTVQAQKALRLMIADENNWRAIFGEEEEISVTLPSGQVVQGMSWGYLSSLLKDVDPVELQQIADQTITAKNQAQGFRNEAEGFKNTANSAKDAAVAAKTAAETAQGKAETAKTAAESAKTAAETAKSQAVTAKDQAKGFRDEAEGFANSADASQKVPYAGVMLPAPTGVKDMLKRLRDSVKGGFWRVDDISQFQAGEMTPFRFSSGVFGRAGDTFFAINVDYTTARVKVYAGNDNGINGLSGSVSAIELAKLGPNGDVAIGDGGTGASDEQGARANLQVMHEQKGSLDSVDLNTLTGDKAGFYRQSVSAKATPELNYPVKEAGCLLVQQIGANGPKSCIQTYTIYIGGRRFMRWISNPDTGNWSQWFELYHSGSSPTFTGKVNAPKIGVGTATLRPVTSGEGSGDGVVWESSNATEASFGIANVGGGSAVFHNYSKPANGSGVATGVLIGGYGSRPWTGTTYTDHSNVSQHFLMDGTASDTNHGGWFRLLTTPLNKTNADRRQTFATSNNGDLYIGFDVPMGLYKLTQESYNGLEVLNGRGLKQVNNTANEIALITPRNGSTANINIRGVAFDGTMAGTKGATQPGDNLWLSFAGHSGVSFTGAAAGIRIQASSGWSTTNLQCGITIATTEQGSTTRKDRWSFTSDGSLSPAADNAYPIGSAVSRVSAVYAANGAIQTSDARLKTEVRGLTEAEMGASKEIAREVGIFQWLARVAEEGDEARLHAGITVQKVMEIMQSYGLDPLKYGFVCYDEWEETSEVISDPDDNSKSTIKITPAGNRYSLRYSELNVFIARGLEQRISELEAKLAG